MTCTFKVQEGCSPDSMAWSRSCWKACGFSPATSADRSGVRQRMPWSVLKWNFTQNRSPAAFTHWNVCEP